MEPTSLTEGGATLAPAPWGRAFADLPNVGEMTTLRAAFKNLNTRVTQVLGNPSARGVLMA